VSAVRSIRGSCYVHGRTGGVAEVARDNVPALEDAGAGVPRGDGVGEPSLRDDEDRGEMTSRLTAVPPAADSGDGVLSEHVVASGQALRRR